MSRLKLVAAASVALCTLGLATPSHALFRAFNPPDGSVNRSDAQRFFVSYHGGIETLVVQPAFVGDASDFGMIFATPTIPDFVAGPDFAFFDELDKLAPDQTPAAAGAVAAPETSVGGMDNSGVSVVQDTIVGNYEAVVLEVSDAPSLISWLNDNGFVYDSDATDMFNFYVNKRWFFTTIKVSHMAANAGDDFSGRLSPFTVKFASDALTIPMKVAYKANDGNIDWTIFANTEGTLQLPEGAVTHFPSKKLGAADLADLTTLNPTILPGDVVTRFSLSLAGKDVTDDVILNVATVPVHPTMSADTGCTVAAAAAPPSASTAVLSLLVAAGLLALRRRA